MCGHRAGMSALKCGFPASSRRATRTQKAIPALALAARMRVARATSLLQVGAICNQKTIRAPKERLKYCLGNSMMLALVLFWHKVLQTKLD